ncbi:MAG TPA: hypothetical protein ENJ50_00145 [Planctomycetaceae bacterium]|nr:hypothetical protein [Planctomycetaceae bacterium]
MDHFFLRSVAWKKEVERKGAKTPKKIGGKEGGRTAPIGQVSAHDPHSFSSLHFASWRLCVPFLFFPSILRKARS